jgi:hypothetical protein
VLVLVLLVTRCVCCSSARARGAPLHVCLADCVDSGDVQQQLLARGCAPAVRGPNALYFSFPGLFFRRSARGVSRESIRGPKKATLFSRNALAI